MLSGRPPVQLLGQDDAWSTRPAPISRWDFASPAPSPWRPRATSVAPRVGSCGGATTRSRNGAASSARPSRAKRGPEKGSADTPRRPLPRQAANRPRPASPPHPRRVRVRADPAECDERRRRFPPDGRHRALRRRVASRELPRAASAQEARRRESARTPGEERPRSRAARRSFVGAAVALRVTRRGRTTLADVGAQATACGNTPPRPPGSRWRPTSSRAAAHAVRVAGRPGGGRNPGRRRPPPISGSSMTPFAGSATTVGRRRGTNRSARRAPTAPATAMPTRRASAWPLRAGFAPPSSPPAPGGGDCGDRSCGAESSLRTGRAAAVTTRSDGPAVETSSVSPPDPAQTVTGPTGRRRAETDVDAAGSLDEQ